MNLLFEPRGWKDYQYFLQTDKKLLKKINDLIQDILRHPFTGIGKPELLKHKLKGFWSRRIEQERWFIMSKTKRCLSLNKDFTINKVFVVSFDFSNFVLTVFEKFD